MKLKIILLALVSTLVCYAQQLKVPSFFALNKVQNGMELSISVPEPNVEVVQVRKMVNNVKDQIFTVNPHKCVHYLINSTPPLVGNKWVDTNATFKAFYSYQVRFCSEDKKTPWSVPLEFNVQ